MTLFSCLSRQADATHERVVKREDGERLAKVNNKDVDTFFFFFFFFNH